MSLKGSVSPPRRETLASMAEEVFTEMRTKSADPFEDDMFIRRASSGRTAECIEGPVRRGQQDDAVGGMIKQRSLHYDRSEVSTAATIGRSTEPERSSSPMRLRTFSAGRDSPGEAPWEECAGTKLTAQFTTGTARQLIYPAPIHSGQQPENEPAFCRQAAVGAPNDEMEPQEGSDQVQPNKTGEGTIEEWVPTHEVFNDKYAIPHKQRHATDLRFESRFESGNLSSAMRFSALEYNLYLRADKGTGGCQWYYFMVANMNKKARYKFNIMHFYKEKSMYHCGLRPLLWSQKDRQSPQNLGWRRAGADIKYCENGVKKKNGCRNFTLSFDIEFPHDDDVCFLAMCYPFTYSDLGSLLLETELLASKGNIFSRSELCKTEAGNSCEIITICNPQRSPQSQTERRPVFFISGRVHPGESNSSYIVKGIIQFLVGEHDIAQALRKHFVFEIIPMLNPDGVIHGHYRVSQSGDDLNRNWTDPSRDRHPTIYYAKKRLKTLAGEGRLLLFCDVHGHSTKKNVFMYGCNSAAFGSSLFGSSDVHQKGLRKEQFFPKLFSDRCSYVSFSDCRFEVDKKKENTGRAAIARECALVHSYTLEASFFGSESASGGNLTHFTAADLESTGAQLCRTLAAYAAGSDHGWEVEDVVTRAMQRAMHADGPPPGASVLNHYRETLKKIETQRAQSGTQSPSVMDAMRGGGSSDGEALRCDVALEAMEGRQTLASQIDGPSGENEGSLSRDQRSVSETRVRRLNGASPVGLKAARAADNDDEERRRSKARDREPKSLPSRGMAPRKHSIDDAICAVFGERYSESDTRVMLMTERERRQQEQAEPGITFVRLSSDCSSPSLRQRPSLHNAHAGMAVDRFPSASGHSRNARQETRTRSPQRGKYDFALHSRLHCLDHIQAETHRSASSSPFPAQPNCSDRERFAREAKRLFEQQIFALGADAEKAHSRIAELRGSAAGSRAVTPSANDLLPPVLCRQDSCSPVQRDPVGGASPVYCSIHRRSAKTRVSGSVSGPHVGCRPRNNTSPLMLESRVAGSKLEEGADIRRSDDELLQRLQRLVARGSNGVEISTPMVARSSGVKGKSVLRARQSPAPAAPVVSRSLGTGPFRRGVCGDESVSQSILR